MKTDLIKKDKCFSTYQKKYESSTEFAHISTLQLPRRGGKGRNSGLFFCCALGNYLLTFNSKINYFLFCPSYQVQASPHYN